MFLSIIVVFLILGIYVFFNHKNSYSYVIAMKILFTLFAVIFGIIYISKTGAYNYAGRYDYAIYRWLGSLRMSFHRVSRVYTLCFAAIMVTSVINLFLITKIKISVLMLLLLPIAFFVYWTDYSVVQQMHIISYTQPDTFLSMLISRGNEVCNTIFITYMLGLYVFYVAEVFRTRVFVKRNYMLLIMVCQMVLDLFIYIMFLYDEFAMIWFDNVDVSMVPKNITTIKNLNITGTYWMALAVVIAVSWVKNPSKSTPSIIRNEVFSTANTFCKNINMMFHIYKNAFIAIGQQVNFVKVCLDESRIEDAKKSSTIALNTINEYIENLEKTLSLLRLERTKPVPFDIWVCLNQAIAQTVPKGVNVIRSYTELQAFVLGDYDELLEVFVNLIINAGEAMKNSGRAPELTFKIISEEEYHLICVRDNGKGVKREDRKKIFDLFYSTKPKSKNSGIGLYYVSNMVKRHSGQVRVVSTMGEFTEFQIALPVYKEKKRRVVLCQKSV